MLRSLTWKLALAFLLVALTAASLVAVSIRLTNPAQLGRLIVEQQRSALKSTLVTYYTEHGSWAGASESVYQPPNNPLPQPTGVPGTDLGGNLGPGPQGPPHDRRALFGLVDAGGSIVIPLLPRYPLGTQVPADVVQKGDPVEVDGQVVGTILTADLPPGLTPAETAYLQRTYAALAVAGSGAVLVAMLVGVLLARTLTRPLRALTQATHRMAGGELEQEVSVKSSDEIGELASAFNQMSQALARANQARRRMTADVAHELRTPLTVIAGYVESMRDGILAPSPARLSIIYAEIEHLQHLVGDLRTLTQADAGELALSKQRVEPQQLLAQTVAAFEHEAARKGVRLELQLSGPTPPIRVDETRMAQVLSNLITNALRYTPEGGRVALGAAAEDGQVTLTVHDTGHGIPAEALPFVFDRFYRADEARSAESGESGLGLAIVKALVEAHGGTIKVESGEAIGTTFSIRLPGDLGQSPP